MNKRFERAHEFVELWEGGFVDDPQDPGGVTKWGITIRTIIAKGLDFNGDGVINRQDILDMKPEQARRVYFTDYWLASRCNDLPFPLAALVYDTAVNQGVSRAKRILQAAVRVKVDGQVGPQTMGAVATEWNKRPEILLREFCARRAVHYSSLSIVVRFGLGWFRRLFAAHANALKLMREPPPAE